jgi:2-deoxy-D-gluconate 3-dehydrogenase
MDSSLFDLSGRVALIAGASRGIGRGIAKGLSQAGATIALSSRKEADLVHVAEDIRACGGRAEVFPADLSSVAQIQALVREVLSRMGHIDILAYIAGVNCRKPSLDITENDWDTVLSLNLKSLFFASQAVGRYWLETRRFAPEQNRGKGKIINIGSIAGEMGIRRVAIYSASKSGVAGVTRSLAVEWASEGICVNCLTPGYIETDLTRARFEDPVFSNAFHNRVPMGHRGYPSDLVGQLFF